MIEHSVWFLIALGLTIMISAAVALLKIVGDELEAGRLTEEEYKKAIDKDRN